VWQEQFIRPYAPAHEYRAHSSHVSEVRFDRTGARLASVGGHDRAVMVWRAVGGVEGGGAAAVPLARRRPASASASLHRTAVASPDATALDAPVGRGGGGGGEVQTVSSGGGLGALPEDATADSEEEEFDDVMSWVSTMDRSTDDLDAD